MTTALAARLRTQIRDTGPIPVFDFMNAALSDPELGYYRSRDPLGAAGDFITAPEISQMFGELLGLWAAVVWQQLGEPKRVHLVELGPGRGTLMKDALRAARQVRGFDKAVRVHLVETSAPLRAAQKDTLHGLRPSWHNSLSTLPDQGPLIVLANEFFDALPVQQLVWQGGVWHRRRVGLDADGAFVFCTGEPADPEPPVAGTLTAEAEDGAILEQMPVAVACVRELAGRLQQQGGAALLIDYGYERTALGETLQAVRRHAYAPVLTDPGDADLTAHVNFQILGEAAAAQQAHVQPLVTQGRFLRTLGIEMRTHTLARSAPDKAESLWRDCQRLIDPAEMGTLFKVMGISSAGLPFLPGFPAGTERLS